uniref:Uncharacterized protein n=1 Tax=Timema tahoe TaxID=61484 RepID=A0A7R9IBT3_9NEOP|nr:unnamed protein product [Timema tahoe]
MVHLLSKRFDKEVISRPIFVALGKSCERAPYTLYIDVRFLMVKSPQGKTSPMTAREQGEEELCEGRESVWRSDRVLVLSQLDYLNHCFESRNDLDQSQPQIVLLSLFLQHFFHHRFLLLVHVIRLSTNYANGLGMGKVGFRRSEPAFVWRESTKSLGENHPSSLNRDLNLDISVLGSLAQHESSTLANYATEAHDVSHLKN